MKLKLHNLLFFGVLIQVISTQGIITFNFFKLFGIWQLKSVVHFLGVLIVMTYFLANILKRQKLTISEVDILFFAYLFISLILLIVNADSISGFLITFREVFLVFILILVYKQAPIPVFLWRKILKWIYIFVLLNILFIGLTYILGPEKYMELLTGRFVWPFDPEYKFKISNFYSFWRSPGLVGEAASLGYFGILAYFLFEEDEKFRKRKIYPLLLAILSIVRSVYLVLVIYFIISFLSKKENIRKIQLTMPYALPFLLILLIPMQRYNLFSFKSIIIRINHWLDDIDLKFNWLTGGGIGKAGAAANEMGFLATLDNYWLLMLISIGLLGIMLILLFIYEKSINRRKLRIILFGFFCTSFFITITQSISFLVLFPLLFLHKQESLMNGVNQ
ncbi:hypothetical protein LS482_08925 [Sinomicrobium kalidii]|uniref:hypothetical protein n=1 Tax=Sinomicrobium kalidii TaxID=2900738 RepID=UPI001E30AE24|nr:hypothetical protein [Sinomicrobium kalidii]UGU17991.1 hypothetical protein LS482_08925 [Sinomicrobium kalidii]